MTGTSTYLSILVLVFICLFCPLSHSAQAADLDSELVALATQPDAVAKGQVTYNQMCFACHGAKLEGAAGPELTDAIWLHGETPSDIFRVITKGVSEKGMMPYEAVYDEPTRKNLVAYILSRQQGLRNVAFEIHAQVENPEKSLPRFGSGTPIKSGTLEKGLIDLSPAEIQEYLIIFRGTVLVPRDMRVLFHGRFLGARGQLHLGNQSLGEPGDRISSWQNLKAGSIPFEFAYQRISTEPRPLELKLRIPGGRDLPLSLDAFQQMSVPENIYAAEDRPKVIRTSLPGIPAESKAVGLPGGISFTLGRDASIYTVWDGLFVNTGPNVTVRGKEPSITGSPWFAHADGIHLLQHGKRLPLRLSEYRFEGDQVLFLFNAKQANAANAATVSIKAEPKDTTLLLHYTSTGLEKLAFQLPAGVRTDASESALLKEKIQDIPDPAAFTLTLHKLISPSDEESDEASDKPSDKTSALDKELEALAGDESALAKGELVYRQMCFACHGAYLEGAAGPSLSDPDHLHGDRPSDLFRVITKGVPEKGMMSYEAVYDEATRKSLVAFILSKQQGLRDLAYEIYPPVDDPAKALPAFGSGDPIKSGTLDGGRIDLSVAEMKEYAIVFRGDFHVPKKALYWCWTINKSGWSTASIGPLKSGEPSQHDPFRRTFEPGVYPFEYAYQRTEPEPNPVLFDIKVEGREIALSIDSQQRLKVPERIYTAEERPRVLRTKMAGIPPESMAVGIPGGTSFSLGRDGSIYTVWDGLFLNTGPNTKWQGKNPSLTGSPWFAHQDGIHLLQNDTRLPLRLEEYRYEGNQVLFFFKLSGGSDSDLRVTVHAESGESAETITMHYAINGAAEDDKLALHLPPGVSIDPKQGPLSQSIRQPFDNQTSFSLTLHKP